MTHTSAKNTARAIRPTVVNESFQVAFDYPVHFGHHVFAPDNPLIADVLDRLAERRRQRIAVFIDEGVVRTHPELPRQIAEYAHARPQRIELACPPQPVPGGEAAKTGWDTVRAIIWTLGNLHMDRQSTVIAIGGGGTLDMVGFAVSIVHRGLRLIRLPTTTLAQCDAGIGVKNGMDEHGQKNFIGTFAPPFAVVNDAAFLATLADHDWIAGVAEAFKVAMIKDAAFFRFLCRSAAALGRRDAAAMETTIRRCAERHLEHIRTSGDPFEFGSARPLDFGHWAAHQLETMSAYALGHGQAVAIGIALDSFCAMRQGLLDAAEFEALTKALLECGLPIWHPCLAQRDTHGELQVVAGLEAFREHLGGALTITLPDGIGQAREVHHLGPDLIAEGIATLGARRI